MINLALAEFLFALILLITAYFISHTINGYIQAYVASRLGDDTAKDAGLMTFNPAMHTDVFGFLTLVLLGIGWLQTVPIDPSAFRGHRLLKLLIAYATEAIVAICLAVISLFLAVYFYGDQVTQQLVLKLFRYYNKPFTIFFSSAHLDIADVFSQYQSPLVIAAAFLLISMVYLNIYIATISIIFNAFRYAIVVGFEKNYGFIEYADYVSFFGPFLVVIVFGQSLLSHLVQITGWGAYHIAHLFGV